jgi:hypothetical protein
MADLPKECINMKIRITSDRKNFCTLLCNLATLGYIDPKEMFPPIAIRDFYSDQYKRNNLVVEQGITWEEVQEHANEGGKLGTPCLSKASFENLIRSLSDAKLLHGTNQEANSLTELFDKARVSLWVGRNDQDMVSIFVPGENTEQNQREVEDTLDFLTAPQEEAETAAAPATTETTEEKPQSTQVAEGIATNPDDIPY